METSVPVSTSDVENTAVIKLVSDGVSSIMTRLYSKSLMPLMGACSLVP